MPSNQVLGIVVDALHTITPLIGVLLGGGLAAIGIYYRERKERKRTIAVALTELLEIRHSLVAVDVIFAEIRSRIELPPEAWQIIRNIFESSIMLDKGVDERFNNAVTVLAGIDPLLAFSLRSKNNIPKTLAFLRNLAIGSGLDSKEFEAIESTLRLAIVPNLNNAVMDLARLHSWCTKRHVQKIISQTSELPPEASHLLDLLKTLPNNEKSAIAPNNGLDSHGI